MSQSETCITCNQPYDKALTANILTDLPILPNFDYANKCLTCIKQQITAIKTDKYPSLCELKKEFDAQELAYKTINEKWQIAVTEYKALDHQIFMIVHKQTQAQLIANKALAKKQANKKPSTKQSSTKKSSTTSLIMKMLANLTPEQQAIIIANIKSQAS